MTEPATTDILIIGNGPVASTLAIAAARAGFSVAVSTPDTDGNGPPLAISAGCWRLLHQIGVAQKAAHHAHPITKLQADAGCRTLVVSPDDMPGNAGEEPGGFVIARSDLTSALASCLKTLDQIHFTESNTPIKLDTSEQWITCKYANLVSHRARLLVACDGAFSPVRTLAGIGQTIHRHNAAAVVFYIQTQHAGVARQIFTPTGPVAMLPMTGGYAAIIWTQKKARARALMALSETDFAQQFDASATQLVRWPYRIDQTRPLALYPVTARMSERLHDYRLVLAGDAARTIHPLAGQGLNLGLKDIAALIHVLEDARRIGLDLGSKSVLADYARWRRADSMTMLAATQFLATIFTAPTPIRLAAAAGVGLFASFPCLRRIAAAEAGSVLGSLPRLLQNTVK